MNWQACGFFAAIVLDRPLDCPRNGVRKRVWLVLPMPRNLFDLRDSASSVRFELGWSLHPKRPSPGRGSPRRAATRRSSLPRPSQPDGSPRACSRPCRPPIPFPFGPTIRLNATDGAAGAHPTSAITPRARSRPGPTAYPPRASGPAGPSGGSASPRCRSPRGNDRSSESLLRARVYRPL
jgi:hypothetical protein